MFLKVCWDVVGKEVMTVFEAFHRRDQWCKYLSATFITLIPKKKGAAQIKEFRLISLVGCLYKLLAKTLAIRLKTFFPSIISESQNAFLPERQITDCSLSNECIDAMQKEGWPSIVCKVDIKKTYDHVSWGYLDCVLSQMGLRQNGEIESKSVSSLSFLVLVNGSPKGFFKRSRGLKQGDPLSPFLFIMVAELLVRMMAKAVFVGFFEGFSFPRGGSSVSFLQFVDDSLFMLKADVDGFRNLRCILLIMEASTGLKVNWGKSTMSPIENVCWIGEVFLR